MLGSRRLRQVARKGGTMSSVSDAAQATLSDRVRYLSVTVVRSEVYAEKPIRRLGAGKIFALLIGAPSKRSTRFSFALAMRTIIDRAQNRTSGAAESDCT